MQTTIHHPDVTQERFIAEGCHILESWNHDSDAGCSIARARVLPGDTTHWHRLHGIAERYLIISGTGRVEVGDLPAEEVGPGDLVIIPPLVRQRITNTGAQDLVFYAICTPRFTAAGYEDLEDRPAIDPEDLEQDLLERLLQHPNGISEHALLQSLRDECHPVTDLGAGDHADHRLFQEHFQLFHLLYRLRDRCRAEGSLHIEINPVRIRVLPYQAADSQLPGQGDPMREYYLDISNLVNTSAQQVDEMLGRFWVRMQGLDQKAAALQTLGLPAEASFDQARDRYRKLAMEHHPDRGGDNRRLQAINAAMDTLARACGRGRSG